MVSPKLDALIDAARSYLGTPFRHCGADRNGVDCVGLILAALRDCGMADYRPRPYARGDHSRLVAEVARFADPVTGEAVPGDLLLLKVKGQITHAALVTEAGTMIHADERAGRVVEQKMGEKVLARIAFVYRWREKPSRR